MKNAKLEQAYARATRSMKRFAALGIVIPHGQALEGVAAEEGYRNWHAYRVVLLQKKSSADTVASREAAIRSSISLHAARSRVAEEELSLYGFGDDVTVTGVESTVWATDGDDLLNVVGIQYKSESGELEQDRVSFHVRFTPDTAATEEVYGLLTSNGTEIGERAGVCAFCGQRCEGECDEAQAGGYVEYQDPSDIAESVDAQAKQEREQSRNRDIFGEMQNQVDSSLGEPFLRYNQDALSFTLMEGYHHADVDETSEVLTLHWLTGRKPTGITLKALLDAQPLGANGWLLPSGDELWIPA